LGRLGGRWQTGEGLGHDPRSRTLYIHSYTEVKNNIALCFPYTAFNTHLILCPIYTLYTSFQCFIHIDVANTGFNTDTAATNVNTVAIGVNTVTNASRSLYSRLNQHSLYHPTLKPTQRL